MSLILESEPQSIDSLICLGLSNKEPTFIEGMEDAGKLIDAMPDPDSEQIRKIMIRMENIANSCTFE